MAEIYCSGRLTAPWFPSWGRLKASRAAVHRPSGPVCLCFSASKIVSFHNSRLLLAILRFFSNTGSGYFVFRVTAVTVFSPLLTEVCWCLGFFSKSIVCLRISISSCICWILLLFHRAPMKMQLFLLSVFRCLALWMDLFTLQHLAGNICAAWHRYSPCYIQLHSILIIHLLLSQSND